MGELKRVSITELREKIGALTGTLDREVLSSPSFSLGIPRGALIELTGHAKVEWLLQFLAAHPKLKICWLEETFTLLPTAFEQRGVNLSRVLFVESRENLFKPLRRVLQSGIFECVILPSVFKEERELKALQLFAEKSNVALFLLARTPKNSWPISVQLHISHRKPGFSIELLKYKRART